MLLQFTYVSQSQGISKNLTCARYLLDKSDLETM